MKDKSTFYMIFFLILGIIAGGCMVMAIGNDKINDFLFEKDYTPSQIPNSESEIIDNCKGLNINETSLCLRDNIETFYYYNISEGVYYDIETIKLYGGNCVSYSELYENLAKQLNFNAEMKTREGKLGVFNGHRTIFIWDSETSCELDMLKVNCRKIDYYEG